jgi:hypothetical protein
VVNDSLQPPKGYRLIVFEPRKARMTRKKAILPLSGFGGLSDESSKMEEALFKDESYQIMHDVRGLPRNGTWLSRTGLPRIR